MRTRRELVLTASSATMAATAGCLGVFDGDTEKTEPSSDLRIRNDAGESVTLQFDITRPLGWTPTGTATRTSDEIVTVFDDEVTVEAGDTRQLDAFPTPGEYVAGVDVVPPNDSETGFHRDADSDNRRIDTREQSLPVEIGVWYVEDSPYYDRATEVTDNDSYLHVLVGDPDLPPADATE